MALSDVIAHIDAEIAKLQQVKSMLSGAEVQVAKSGRGRPRGSKNAATVTAAAPVAAKKTAVKGKRELSPEGRQAIADAMKRRWAERRKAAGK